MAREYAKHKRLNLSLKFVMDENPIVETQMMIRRPIAEVFNAFIDPEITTKFWFSRSSGPLEAGKAARWHWEMYNVSSEVFVKDIISNRKISTDWGDPKTCVNYNFTALTDKSTYVVITSYGFKKTGNELIQLIKDSTGGFTTVLDVLNAYLEHNIQLNLIADKFPHLNLK